MHVSGKKSTYPPEFNCPVACSFISIPTVNIIHTCPVITRLNIVIHKGSIPRPHIFVYIKQSFTNELWWTMSMNLIPQVHAIAIAKQNSLNIDLWYDVLVVLYDPWGLSSLTPIYFYIPTMNFDVLWAKNSSLKHKVLQMLNRGNVNIALWYEALVALCAWYTPIEPKISLLQVIFTHDDHFIMPSPDFPCCRSKKKKKKKYSWYSSPCTLFWLKTKINLHKHVQKASLL